MMGAFLAQFYIDMDPPRDILVSTLPKDQDVLEAMLHQRAGHAVCIASPKRGDKYDILASCLKNAESALARTLSEAAHHQDMMDRIAHLFDLPTPLNRIELYDNSHIQGAYALGAMVVVGPSGFEKSSYRTYKMSVQDLDTRDDYAMMRHMIDRRLSGDQPLPDLMLIDGGPGQLSSVLSVLAQHNITLPIVAIAKGPDRNAGREVFYRPDQPPLSLDPRDPALYDLQRLRDEVHRFAITRHRKRREKAIRDSALDDIAGVGPSRKRALLAHFGSVAAVKSASLKDLERAPGVSRALAQRIFEGLN
jgi:excinuclease ABC subunit C